MWWCGNAWERGSHTFLHNSNVTCKFRFFISISTRSGFRELQERFACEASEQYLVLEFLEFDFNLNQVCSGVGTAFPHLFV